MNNDDKEVAWSLYWSQDRLHSCVASGNSQDQKVLDDLWGAFATSLPQKAKVLDLATGNGAVPSAMLSARLDLDIDAVDQADIDPLKFLSGGELLRDVRFHANTDILRMNFEENQFDAITSQFGIEYAGLQAATMSAQRLLRPGGRILFFIHHQGSALITDSKSKIEELTHITKTGGLLSSLQEFLNNGYNMEKLNIAGQQFLQGDFVRSNAISGQLFEGIEQLISLLSKDTRQANLLAMSMDLRIRSEQQRLEQMVASAHSEDSLNQLCDALRKYEISSGFSPINIEDQNPAYLLCWQFSAEKHV